MGVEKREAASRALKLSIRRDEAALTDPWLAEAWDAAVAGGGSRMAFRSRAWVRAWWGAFGTPGALRIVTLTDGQGRVSAILPCFEERRSGLGLPWRRWRFLGTGIVGSDYLGALLFPGATNTAAKELAGLLRRLPADLVVLDDVAADDPLLMAVRVACGARATEEPAHVCPLASLGTDFEAYLADRPGGAGTQFLRRRRWLERNAEARLVIIGANAPAAELERAMQELFRLHEARWDPRGGSDGIAGPRVRAFHLDAVRRLARYGWPRVFLLHAGGRCVAALYGLQIGRSFLFYQSGFDPSWAARSVGSVLLGMVIERCMREGLEEFDFLRGEEGYKLQWATGRRETRRLVVTSPGAWPRVGLLASRMRTRVRRTARLVAPEALRSAWLWRERERRLAAPGGY
jgi:CelD/BcsL family acetyltransferase involved in cellulose biosynthesis